MSNFIKLKSSKIIGGTIIALSILGFVFSGNIAKASSLTTDQVNAIVNLLKSFNADSATIANVQASLNGKPAVPSTITTYFQVGNRGNDVKNYQNILNQKGFSVGLADGIFGNKTRQAIINFQTRNGLTATGIIDQATINALNGNSNNPAVVNPPTTTPTPTSTTPTITSIYPSSGSIGTTIELKGNNLAGFEGDLDATIENSQGETAFLQGIGSVPRADQTIRVKIDSQVCKQGNSYSGLPCQSYLNITPGVYKIYTMPWGVKSNVVNFTVTSSTISATYTYTNHGFSIELPKGFIPKEEQSEGGPAYMITLPIGGLAYVTDASFWEKYNIPSYTYIKDQKIGNTTFKVYTSLGNNLYWFKQGNVGYEFSVFKFGVTTDTTGLESLLKTFKYIGWSQTTLTQAQAQTLVLQTWGGCTPDTCGSVTVTVQNNNNQYTVTAVYEGLRDDSSSAQKKVALASYNNNVWSLGTPVITQSCQPGRGHQDFSSVLCY